MTPIRRFLRQFTGSLVLFALFALSSVSYSQSNMAYFSYCTASSTHWMFSGDYDTVTGSWSHISPLSKPLYGVTSYYWPDSNKIFLCGGTDTSNVLQTSCFFYGPTTNTYSQKASLPVGRTLGKLVRVRDSLYLVGSVGPSWTSPDGLIYKYSPNLNSWSLKDTMPHPFLHESAVSVWRDSLIVTIGGAANGWYEPASIVRIYNPWNDTWMAITNSYPFAVTTAHAECLGDSLLVVGGLSTDYLNTVYKGVLDTLGDSLITVSWTLFDVTPFGAGVYRVGGGRWGNILLFGPAMRYQYAINQVWGFRWSDSTWIRFLPNTLDSAGNRPTIAVQPPNDSTLHQFTGSPLHPLDDSVRFYLFGGSAGLNMYASAEQYTYYPSPIGIISTQNSIPKDFFLDQNYPNPLNPATHIKFGIPQLSPLPGGVPAGRGGFVPVQLTIYDILGRKIATLVDQELKPGTYEIEWNAANLPSGIYFYTLIFSGNNLTRKMVLIK